MDPKHCRSEEDFEEALLMTPLPPGDSRESADLSDDSGEWDQLGKGFGVWSDVVVFGGLFFGLVGLFVFLPKLLKWLDS